MLENIRLVFLQSSSSGWFLVLVIGVVFVVGLSWLAYKDMQRGKKAKFSTQIQFCPHCGERIAQNADYCGSCGKKIFN